MKKIVFLFFVLFLISCSEQEPTTYNEMKSDEFMSDFFTDNELQDLAKIVDLFESDICLDKSKSKEKCYFEFNQKIGKYFYEGKLEFSKLFDYKKQKKLYSTIDSILFNEIWVKRWSSIRGENFKLSKYYNLKINGKYASFLRKFSQENPFYEGYYNSFNLTGDVHYIHFIEGFKKIKIEDIKDIKVKLLIAIHYLTNCEISQFPYKKVKK
jgi:hypothetical protein